jgi:hypothetical protein
MRAAQEVLGAQTIGGGSARPGVVVGESKKSNKPSKLPEMYKIGAKRTVTYTYCLRNHRKRHFFLLKST